MSKFDIANVYDFDDAAAVLPGNSGYFSDSLVKLKAMVEQDSRRQYGKVMAKDFTHADPYWVESEDGIWYKYFYLYETAED